MNPDIVVIGGGPAGLAAAKKAAELEMQVVLIERNKELGGILFQCIHPGFGTFLFNKTMTGPEYAQYFIDKIKNLPVMVKTNTMVIEITKEKTLLATSSEEGLFSLHPKAIILAMGCRERTRSQILLPGTRPAGIYTAGTAQRLINLDGIMPGKKIVILGSGDVGLIMARRFILEGAEVKGVYEILPYPSGLTRNVVQCLEDYRIPLYLSHTITAIHGKKRVEGVSVAEVEPETGKRKDETERFVACDCLILAVGLIPENELSKSVEISMDRRTDGPVVNQYMQTSVPGIFACGNVVCVHDYVDDLTVLSEETGKYATQFIHNKLPQGKTISVRAGKNITYVVPQQLIISQKSDVTLYYRVKCEILNAIISVRRGKNIVYTQNEIIVRPSELLKLRIPRFVLSNHLPNEIFVEVDKSNDL